MIKIKRPSKKVIYIIGAIILVGLIAISVYNYMQIKGLKNRATSAENQVNDLNAYIPHDDPVTDESMGIYGEGAEYKVLSVEDKTLRVENTVAYNKNQTSPELTYESKSVKVIKLQVKNTSETVYTLDGYSLQGQTANGELLAPITLHPDDYVAQSNSGLAPGGTGELYIYVENNGTQIVGLYDTISNKVIKLN